MKTILAFFFLSLVFFSASSQVVDEKPHKMVMQFTEGAAAEQEAIVGQVGNILTAWPNAKIEVVCHSSGLDLLVSAKSQVAPQIEALTAKGVVFAACNNSMKKRNVTKEQLLSTAVVVPSAMVELVTKQEEGWAYLKGAH